MASSSDLDSASGGVVHSNRQRKKKAQSCVLDFPIGSELRRENVRRSIFTMDSVFSSESPPSVLKHLRWSDLKDKVHDVQANLALKTKDRQCKYVSASSPFGHAAASSSHLQPHLSIPGAPGVHDERPAPERGSVFRSSPCTVSVASSPSEWQTLGPILESDVITLRSDYVRGRCNSLQDNARSKRSSIFVMGRKRGLVDRGMAYMGIDWYIMSYKKHQISPLFFIQHMYYWCYAGYIVFVIVIGAFLLALSDNGLDGIPALYTAAACVSQSGLAVVDWSTQAEVTYLISFCLILLGSAPLLHCVPVLLRVSNFRAQAKMTRLLAKRKSSSEEGLNESGRLERSQSDPCLSLRGIPGIHEEGLNSLTAPLLPTDLAVSQPKQINPKSTIGKGQRRCSDALPSTHRMEYKALRMILKIMFGYWFCCHILGCLIFFLYFTFGDEAIRQKCREHHLNPSTHALYLTVSSFQNNGLTMTPSSVMEFSDSPFLLTAISSLIILGNTGLPIMTRAIVTILERLATAGSEKQRVLHFLLEHPRRCFTHMFPAVHTLWLLLVVVALNTITTAVILEEDSNTPAFANLNFKFCNAFFQSVSTRTAGLNSVNIAELSQGTTFFLCVMMYLATTPTVVTMRLSAVTGSGGRAELDITGRAEGIEEEILTGDNSLKTQARRYLTQDVTYLTIAIFLICCFEKENFVRSAKDVSPDSDGIYGDFTFFKVMFEISSAYGTCGLSLGYQDQSASFSQVWRPESKFVLVCVMILGRLRGLPDSIDPSVRIAMSDVRSDAHEEEHQFIHA